jgi:toxin ParE1/3/4
VKYRISRSASRDLNAIADYFLERNVNAGERFLQEFNRKCQYLTQFPDIGKSDDHLLSGARGLPLDGYIIF